MDVLFPISVAIIVDLGKFGTDVSIVLFLS